REPAVRRGVDLVALPEKDLAQRLHDGELVVDDENADGGSLGQGTSYPPSGVCEPPSKGPLISGLRSAMRRPPATISNCAPPGACARSRVFRIHSCRSRRPLRSSARR